uniref:Transmembrane domain-containing protein n=1 Tax=Spironucleus salmonicida TaxID=348837 RepID=V6LMT3_9EUKA|eukprot:EST45528.1 Transmembrane domain-containing protein [Spironucleus salmonicida]
MSKNTNSDNPATIACSRYSCIQRSTVSIVSLFSELRTNLFILSVWLYLYLFRQAIQLVRQIQDSYGTSLICGLSEIAYFWMGVVGFLCGRSGCSKNIIMLVQIIAVAALQVCQLLPIDERMHILEMVVDQQ